MDWQVDGVGGGRVFAGFLMEVFKCRIQVTLSEAPRRTSIYRWPRPTIPGPTYAHPDTPEPGVLAGRTSEAVWSQNGHTIVQL